VFLEMDEEDFLSSDSGDEDYVPSGGEESDGGGPESSGEEFTVDDDGETKRPKRGTKRKGKGGKAPRKRISRGKVEEENEEEEKTDQETPEKKELDEEGEKKHSDALWSDFLKDTKTTLNPKPKDTSPTPLLDKSSGNGTSTKKEPPKVYTFAGEEVKIFDETSKNSKTESVNAKPEEEEPTSEQATPSPSQGIKKAGGGLSSILGKISGKGTKLSTLDKSKLDWNQFKSQEGIEEELSTHNRGKEGYLERQAFLQRTDLRQFEIEKNLRALGRR